MGFPEMGRDPYYYINEKGERVRVPEEAELGIGDFFKKLLGVKSGNPNRDAGGRFARPSSEDTTRSAASATDVSDVPMWPTDQTGVPGVGRKGEDPFVTEFNGKQVLIESTDGSDLVVSYLDDKLASQQETKITLVKGEKNIWAPELHKINGDWKIFYSSTGNSDKNEDHRMYVLGGSKSPFGPFTTKTQLGPKDVWGIDMTPFKVGKKNYVSWSGWDGPNDGFPQNLYVAELKTDRKGKLSTGPRVKIASPSGWEGQIMEGPQFVKNPKGGLVLTYSGNKSWSTDYSLGAIKLNGNPLNPKSWKKSPKPIARNVGHGSFVKGKLVFHTKTSPKEGWDDRELRLANYKWVDGLPVLDIPKKPSPSPRYRGRARPAL